MAEAELLHEINVLKEQQSKTIEVMRQILMGNFEDGRIWLDAIDPNRAGKWRNVEFPKV